METKTVSDAAPKTEEDYQREIDQMTVEIRAMLDNSGRRLERASRVRGENRRLLANLEQQLLCGND